MSEAFSDISDPEIEVRLRLALARVSRGLGHQEMVALRGHIARQVEMASCLNAVTLRISDEPAHECTFTPGNLDGADQRP